MVDIGTILRHYKRPDIQKEMVWSANDREVAVRFSDKGFGKRPDTLMYPNDVLELAKQQASSFHVSEEHWENVLSINPALKPKELNDLRIGWDLVLDIDCPDWDISRITTDLIVKALKEHGIKTISAKFSGNKGFHLGVPLKSFPKSIHGKEIKDWFPDGPKRIAAYLLDYISEKEIKELKDGTIVISNKYEYSIETIKKVLNKSDEELFYTLCDKCNKKISLKQVKTKKFDFICSKCGYSEVDVDGIKNCKQCNFLMDKIEKKNTKNICSCGSDKFTKKFDTTKLIDVDTLLISSRHLYRMPYSLHEKSGLASVPINPADIINFNKEFANPNGLKVSKYRFLDSTNTVEGEASNLVMAAFEHNPIIVEETIKKFDFEKEFESLTTAIPADFFPPCIAQILSGLEDGKKRSMFVLINFLSNTGYDYDKIDEILHDWNNRNREPLREVLVKGQVRYRRVQKKRVLPPNCSNMAYYKNFGVCHPDNFCARIRNPVNYTVLKAKIAQGKDKNGRKKLTEEQKEMRRKFREKKKLEKKLKKEDIDKKETVKEQKQ
jgi:hypothetical protein